ncbi:hypothetical protein ACKUFS_17885 [Pseudomonas cannabina]|uniref:Uncharacterized protein n=2 Tax=Pseudomonas syringae group TaxID=136849 RepID=A0A8T8C6X2_PSEYM|nr:MULTISPECIES: hypothetical protein [Pseudomonas syringae group]MBM0141061.1 hypothetical protein [Pseudomonas cannabina pv. alisalensis]QHE99003.1 hypothetical protein PMA4326_021980 [Pseudomonas syringae pv. maculicola str. ES4326]QQN21264.1 hypothetical protein JGS08_22220 [Pseudomonas cannabina pv. alisalensis]UBY99666.1 hypothetical protein LCG56_11510 [Pseudomonas cannabina pv. alisalensis]
MVDTKNGYFLIDDGFVIQPHLTRLELEKGLGVHVETSVDGDWSSCVSGPHIVVGQKANMQFDLYRERLIGFKFTVVSSMTSDLTALRALHDQILRDLLGEPDKENENMISYDFFWGVITSYLDPRGGSCCIGVRWS